MSPKWKTTKRHQGIILISRTPSPPAYITNYNIHMGLTSEASEGQFKVSQ